MPYEISWEKHGCVIHFTGNLNDGVLLSVVADVQGNPLFDNLHYIVADHSCCTQFSVNPDCLEYVIATYAASALSNNRIKVALISASPEIFAGTYRFITSPLTVFQSRIFKTLESANKWLGRQEYFSETPKQ